MSEKNAPVVAPEDRVPMATKLAYALGGPVDILAVWILVSIAYPFFNMELHICGRFMWGLLALRYFEWIGMLYWRHECS